MTRYKITKMSKNNTIRFWNVYAADVASARALSKHRYKSYKLLSVRKVIVYEDR